MTFIGLCYVGDASHAFDAATFIDRRTDRDVRVVAVVPDRVESVLSDDRVDVLICGGSLDAEGLQRVVDGVNAAGSAVPVFDLTSEVAAVPESVDHYNIYPGTDPAEAADRVLAAVDAASDRSETRLDVDRTAEASAEWTRPVFQGMDAYLAVDAKRRVTAWDPSLADWLDVDLTNAVGRSLTEVLPPAGEDAFRTAFETVDGTGKPETAEFRTPDDDWFRVQVAPDGRGGFRCFVRDISELKAYEAEIEATQDRFENTLERITDAFFVLDHDERIVLLNSRAELVLGIDADDVVGERFWDVFPAAVNTTFYHGFTEAMDTQEPASFETHYEREDTWLEVNAYPSEDGLSVFLRDVTERIELRHKLESLHETTQRLIVAESDDEIATDALEAAVDVLGFPLTVCWRYDETRRRLEPIAHSDAVEKRVAEVQPIEPGDGPAWASFEEGDRRVIDSVAITTPSTHHPGDVASALLVPLGEYGLLGTYGEEEEAFDETDVKLFRILATAVESAMARAERQRQLTRRNDRLDDFASTVSHDLRNPLHVATARTELARESGDVDHLDAVSEALDRMETLIEDLLARARGQRDVDRQPVSLATTARDAWDGLDTKSAELSVEDEATFSADPTRLTQLFENLYRNAVEHAGEDVTVRVGTHGSGFYLADDGSGIPDEVCDDLFEQGVTGSEEGTGYGLAIVSDIVRSHDWSIEATESAEGGARFEVCHVHSLTEQQPA